MVTVKCRESQVSRRAEAGGNIQRMRCLSKARGLTKQRANFLLSKGESGN